MRVRPLVLAAAFLAAPARGVDKKKTANAELPATTQQDVAKLNNAFQTLEDLGNPKDKGTWSSDGLQLIGELHHASESPAALQEFQQRMAAFHNRIPVAQRGEAMAAFLTVVGPQLEVISRRNAAGNPGTTVVSPAVATTETTQPSHRATLMGLATTEGTSPEFKGMAVTMPGYGDPHKVVKLATDAIEGGVKDPKVFLVRGQSAEKLGDSQLANTDAARVLRMDPSNAEAQSLFKLTRDRRSTVRLTDPSALGGDDGRLDAAGVGAGGATQWDGQQRGGAAFAEYGRALTPAEIAAQENAVMNAHPVSAHSAALTRDAKAALKVKDTKSALRLTEEALRADPNNADARYARATAFLQMKDPAQAAYEASAGLALAPDNAPLLYTRAVANGRQKLWRDAFADAEGAVRSAPRAGYAYQVRAAANWALGRKPEMVQDLRTSASLDRAYAAALQRASQLPGDVDPTLLFGDAPQGAAPAQRPPASRPPYLFWGIGSLLAVIGIAPFLISDVRKKVTTVFRRRPAAAEGGAAAEGAEVPLTGFWKRYEVTREIGAGGMGVVYEAWDRQLERRVAVKRMRDEIRNDRRERERFLQEARMVARLHHVNLVEIYGIEEDGDDAYLVFEFVEGQNLHQMLGAKGRFTPAEARDVFRGLCAGIDYAHRQGIVHRDLKPANVIVEPDGTVKVMDFGVARQAADALARRQMTNTIIGTPQYMAPEQEEGVVCTQSDIYALGVCLYEMLSGSAPFNGSAGAVTLAKRESRYEPLAKRVGDLPPAVAQVVDRALDPNPETRTRTAVDFMRDLEAAVSNVTA